MFGWKKWFAALMLAATLLFVCAAAESGAVYPMPMDNVTPEVVEGMELLTGPGMSEDEEGNMVEGEVVDGYGVIHEDGSVKIVIDTEKTDWNTVVGYSMNPEDGYVYWGPYISAGNFIRDEDFNVIGFEGPVYGQGCGTGEIADSDIPGLFEEDEIPSAEELAAYKQNLMENEEYPNVEYNMEIGRYYENCGVFVPMPTDEHYYVVRWFNEDGSCYYEKLRLEVQFTDTESVQLEEPIGRYFATDIVAGYNLTDAQRGAVAITVADGNVRYHVDTTVFNSDDNDINIDTYVLCPDPTVTEPDWTWECTTASWGSSDWPELETITVDGSPRLAARIASVNTCEAREDNSPRNMYVCWTKNEFVPDESGMGGEYEQRVAASGTLTISALEKGTERSVGLADVRRVSLDEVEGLVADLAVYGNQWKIEIDEEATDWAAVAQNGEFSEEGMLILNIRIGGPDSATHNAGFGTSENNDEFILSIMQDEPRNEGNEFVGGCEVGTIEGGVFKRRDFSDELLCVQWSDEAGNIISTEKLVYGTVWGSFDGEEGGEGGEGGGDDQIELPIIDPANATVVNVGLEGTDTNRVGTINPGGMVLSMNFDEDSADDPQMCHWTLTIDNEATDWQRVFKRMYDAENNVVSQRFLLIGPENAVYSRSLCTSITDDDELLEMFTWFPTGRMESVVTNCDELGSYVEGINMFQPTVNPNRTFVMAAQWFDADMNLISTEKFMYRIRFTDSEGNENTDPTSVKLDYIPADQIVAYGDYYEDYEHCLTAKKDRGYIRYNIDAQQAGGEGLDLMTWVLCPVYMDEDESNDSPAMDDWRCEMIFDMDPMECELEWLDYGEDGRYLAARVHDFWVDTDADRVDTYSWNLTWYTVDENGDLSEEKQHGCMRHYIQVGEAEPWPVYVADWEAIPAENIAGITAVNEIDGLTATYTDGILHIGLEEDKLPSGADLSAAHFTVEVTPPEGAVSYREIRSGGNNIFGDDEYAQLDQEDSIQYRPLCMIETDPYVLEVHPCDKFTSKISDDLTMSIYLSRESTPEYGGDVNLIHWYDADGNVISKQWIVERYDSIMRVQESGSYNDESELTGMVEVPVIIVFEKGGRTNKYNLRIVSYPQEGTDFVYYDLTLVDKNGNEVELSEIDKLDNKRCKIYMPYPDDYVSGSKVKFNIHHLNSKHHAKEYFSEDSDDFKVYRTEYGLCIEVNSLSPFVISWEAKEIEGNAMVLPDNLTEIREQAFMNGTFETVWIPDSCETIGSGAFAGVQNLTAYMPNNDSLTIDETAFEWDSVTLMLSPASADYILSIVPEDCKYTIVY